MIETEPQPNADAISQPSTSATEPDPQVLKLSQDLEKILGSSENSDIVFVVEGKQFPAHSAILEARCPALLSVPSAPAPSSRSSSKQPSKPSRSQRTIELKNVAEDAMLPLLRYIYTSNVRNSDSSSRTLLKAATEYHLDELRDLCVNKIRESLSFRNCIDHLTYAENIYCEPLKVAAMQFIHANKNEVIELKEVNNLLELKHNHPHLLEELYCYRKPEWTVALSERMRERAFFFCIRCIVWLLLTMAGGKDFFDSVL